MDFCENGDYSGKYHGAIAICLELALREI